MKKLTLILVTSLFLMAGCSKDRRLNNKLEGKWIQVGNPDGFIEFTDAHKKHGQIRLHYFYNKEKAIVQKAAYGPYDIKDGKIICIFLRATINLNGKSLHIGSYGDIPETDFIKQ